MMENIQEIINEININQIKEFVSGLPSIILLLGTGLYLTIRLKFFQFTHFIRAWKETFGQFFAGRSSKEQGQITSFQALSSTMAGTIGTGNIAGVSTAIAMGGPGAVFWMWISALVGMATKFAEATLGLKYREIDSETGEISGGVMYYIQNGLGPGWRWLAMFYAVFAGIAALGIGNMVQSNTVSTELRSQLTIISEIPEWVLSFIIGIILVVLVGLVTLGGINRIAKTAEKIVPIMAAFYLLGGLFIILFNLDQVPGAISSIFYHAFNPREAMGNFEAVTAGTAVRFGIARGLFSNEAGLGGASIIHAQAQNTPARQGMWGLWGVFIDTIVVCSITAFSILVTDSLEQTEIENQLTSTAFDVGLPGPTGSILTLAIALFAFSSMLTWNFYGEKSWEYVFGSQVITGYRILFLIFVLLGAMFKVDIVWDIATIFLFLMAFPNLIALILLAKPLITEKNRYLSESKRESSYGYWATIFLYFFDCGLCGDCVAR